MISSVSIAVLAEALVKAQESMEAAKKATMNPGVGKPYADLSSVWAAVAGPLHDNGLAVVQGVSGGDGTMTVATRLLHKSGEWLEDSVTLPYAPTKKINECQAAGSAITYGRRYGLSAMCCLATEDDDGISAGAVAGAGTDLEVHDLRPALVCPICKGPMYDNRGDKTNPNSPDGKCKNKECKGRIWPEKGKPAPSEPTLDEAVRSVLAAGSLENPPIGRERIEGTAGKKLEELTIDTLRGLREEIKAGTLPPF